MRLWPTFLVCSVVIVAISLVGELNAQTTTSGGLAGVVIDPSYAVVPDADVTIKDNAKGSIQSTKTDQQGAYRFFFLAPGRYELNLASPGFREENRAVTVPLGPPVSANITLQILESTTSVSVIAEAPLIRAENGDVSATTNQRQISEVPNPGNDLTYIVQTAPGAIMNGGAGVAAARFGKNHHGRLCAGDDAGEENGPGQSGRDAAGRGQESGLNLLCPRCVPAENRGFRQVFYFVGVPDGI